MSTTLHNKIQLGRGARRASNRLKTVLALGALGALTGVGLVLAAIRTMR